jgi:hypothetical protein
MGDLVDIKSYNPGKDPAAIGWPPTLPVEIALKTAPMSEIREAYGYSLDEWMALKGDPAFLADLAAAMQMVKKEGMSFKLKARLQAEELLKTSWRLIHAPQDEVPSSVKADLLKATMRWAGYDVKEQAAVTGGAGLNIQINLG